MSTIKRTGIWFALAAWLMQISVFLTPIFSDQVSVGHGVCVRLADVVAAAALAHAPHDYTNDQSHGDAEHAMHLLHTSTHADHADDPHADHGQHNTHENHQKQLITQDHLTPPSTAPPHTTDSTTTSNHHAMDSAQCGFCLLIGHSVLPPVPEARLQAVAFFDLAQADFSNTTNHALSSLRGLIPQSRAPPILI